MTNLQLRKGNYYLRLRVPTDLTSKIPSVEFLKSLHTKDRRTARVAGACLQAGILQVFTLTRTGFITPIQAIERLDTLLDRKQNRSDNVLYRRVAVSSPNENPAHLLLNVIVTYKRDKEAGWTGKTLIEYNSYFKLIADVVGNVNVTTINRGHARNLRDSLARLPANLYKRHPGLTVQQVLALPDLTPMNITTVNKLLTLFGSLMRHCIAEGYIQTNPVEGLKVPNQKRPDEERKAYSVEDLQKIVAALPSPTVKPDRYWIPIIGMFSGMRLGEMCGMHVEDIRQVEGVWCFDVNEEGDKRLKTLASTRLVPIHQHLIQNGFLRFVENLRNEGIKRLWPNLVRRETDGYCHALGNWFGRFNRKHVTLDPLKSFHSLRHTFADTLKQQGEQETLISELMGHVNGNITTGRYGKRYKPGLLLQTIGKLDYGCFMASDTPCATESC
jgi:integrase